MPLAWFKDPANRPITTLRGQLARALQDEQVAHVLVGEVIGEHAFVNTLFGDASTGRIETWCTIKVWRSFKGVADGDGTVTVLYRGGALSQDVRSWPSHSPRCLPFDYGLFVIYDAEGVLTPGDRLTRSMLGHATPWQEHPLTVASEAVSAELRSSRE